MELKTDISKTYQTFTYFGASGAWWAQEVGAWDEKGENGLSKRDEIARLLYSVTDGIGLGVYRYNIGGGSQESGRGFYYDELRRAEFFGRAESPDFTRDKNAVYMMEKAASYGAKEIVLFVNSPPEYLTKNSMAQLGKHSYFRTNLAKKNYRAFADYCLGVTSHFVSVGLPVKYLSPVNEPVWLWNGGQEGCHYSPRQAAAVMKVFAEELKKRPELAKVRLSGVENGDIRFFNKTYTRLMLKDPLTRSLVDSVDVHSYFTHLPLPAFMNDRRAFLKRFRAWLDRKYPSLDIKMSEWTDMRGGRDAGIDSALVTAETIIDDLTILGASSWQHWLACSPYDYHDGLIYIYPEEKRFELTKRYFVTGNFSKYIPFGAVRAEVSTGTSSVKAVCFIKNGRTVTVMANLSDADESFTVPVSGEIIITDETRNLEADFYKSGEKAIVPKKSVITYVSGG